MVQEWLDEAKISAEELRTRVKLKRRRNVYRTEDWNGLSMQSEWKRVLGLVKIQNLEEQAKQLRVKLTEYY